MMFIYPFRTFDEAKYSHHLIHFRGLRYCYYRKLRYSTETFLWSTRSKHGRQANVWRTWLKDIRAKIFQHWFFFWDFYHLKLLSYLCQKCKKNVGSPTSFRREQAWEITLNLKNRNLLANKATMSVSPKIMQLDLWSEIFSAKYCSSRPSKWN